MKKYALSFLAVFSGYVFANQEPISVISVKPTTYSFMGATEEATNVEVMNVSDKPLGVMLGAYNCPIVNVDRTQHTHKDLELPFILLLSNQKAIYTLLCKKSHMKSIDIAAIGGVGDIPRRDYKINVN